MSGAEITNENGVRLKGYVEIKSGKVVIPLLYNNSYHERNGIFYAEKNGEVHRYNSTGKCIEGCTNNNTNQVLASSAKKTPTNSTKTNSKSKIAAVKKSATKNANSNTGKICDEALVIYNEWKKNQFSNNYFFESNGYKYSFSKIKYKDLEFATINKWNINPWKVIKSFVFNIKNLTPIFDCDLNYDVGHYFVMENDPSLYVRIFNLNRTVEQGDIGIYNITKKRMEIDNVYGVAFKNTNYNNDGKNMNEFGDGTFYYEVRIEDEVIAYINKNSEDALIYNAAHTFAKGNRPNTTTNYKYWKEDFLSKNNDNNEIKNTNNISIISKTNIENIKFKGGNYLDTSILNHTGSVLSSAPQDVILRVYNKDGKLIKEKNTLSSDIWLDDYDFPATINLSFEQDSKYKSASFVIYSNGQIELY